MSQGQEQAAFWGLLAVAVTLHFSYFTWDTSHQADILFFKVRTHQEVVQEKSSGFGGERVYATKVEVKNDLSLAMCLGLAVPIGLIALGWWLASAKALVDAAKFVGGLLALVVMGIGLGSVLGIFFFVTLSWL